jgi:hypothetical protein
MADENKLGTTVTYMDPNDKRKPVRIQGVSLAPNKATNLADFMPQEKAEQLARRLSTNHHFQVEGGPDHEATREDQQARLFEHEQEVQRAFRNNQARRQPEPALNEPEAPESYNAPEATRLENAPHLTETEARKASTNKAKSK